MDPSTKQQLYCLECIIAQQQAPSFLQTSLQSIASFIDTAANHYLQAKNRTTLTASEPPADYLTLLSSQNEVLEAFGKHIAGEKKRIGDQLDLISRYFLEIIADRRKECLQALDQYYDNLYYWYMYFDKQVKRAYPSQENIHDVFPSRDDLTKKLESTTDFAELSAFVRSVKEDLAEKELDVHIQRRAADQNLRLKLSKLSKKLSQLGSIKTAFINTEEQAIIGKDLQTVFINTEQPGKVGRDLQTLAEKALIELLDKRLTLKDPLVDVSCELSTPDSKIIDSTHIELLKEWLPNEYKSLGFKLLYRGSEDGMNSHAFHAKCDNKGPNITVIKCRFNCADNTSIIGGFLDDSWCSETVTAVPGTSCRPSLSSRIKSVKVGTDASFLFSLSSRVKCPFIEEYAMTENDNSMQKVAAQSQINMGPIFGRGYDLILDENFQYNYVRKHSYQDADKLIDCSPGYESRNTYEEEPEWIYFRVEEIEVYGLE